MTKKKFFTQGILITFISLILRITNIGYRSYLSQEIGAEGMGLYQLIFSIFMLSVTLSTSGISLAVTRMVTQAIAANKRNTIRSLVTKCFFFCLLCSLFISMLLLVFSTAAAKHLLGNEAAAPCLRILALGLPFMSVCTCMKGYFLAVDESVSTSVSDMLENMLSIAATAFFFIHYIPQGIESACFAAMLASSLGEMTSCTYSYISYRRSLRRNTPKERKKSHGVLHGLTHIALPCTLSSAARSVLSTIENLLIPKQLQVYGQSYSASMAQYGLLQAMTMPMLYFPSSLLTSFASLLIPRVSKERELGHKKSVAYITGTAISAALTYGIFFAAIFMIFGDSWGFAFYKSPQAGNYLKIFAPIVPLIYLDIVVDSLLKGMDEQLNSMKFNLTDAFFRVVLVLCLMQFFGMESYIGILFFSTIFNAALSLGRLLKVTKVKISPVKQIALPMLLAVLSVMLSKNLISLFSVTQPFILVLLQIGTSALIFLLLHKLVSFIFRDEETQELEQTRIPPAKL